MHGNILVVALASLTLGAAAPEEKTPLILTSQGVTCDLGEEGKITLGIPALDGRKTHAPALASTIQTDGKTLTAAYGEPFKGVTLAMKILDGTNVQYRYSALPSDLHIVMCQFNIPASTIVPGLSVSFDHGAPKLIPAAPGKSNKDVTLASTNAKLLTIQWPGGKTLLLTSLLCWHGIQDARVWAKNFVGVCLTPPVARDVPQGDTSTFVMKFELMPPGDAAVAPVTPPAAN